MGTVVECIIMTLPCIWVAMLLLGWRDVRRDRRRLSRVALPEEHAPQVPPDPRPRSIWTWLMLPFLILVNIVAMLIFWPMLVVAYLGRQRSDA